MICSDTVDGRNPTHQLRLVVYPIIYKVLYIPGAAGFLPSTMHHASIQEISSGHFRKSICDENEGRLQVKNSCSIVTLTSIKAAELKVKVLQYLSMLKKESACSIQGLLL